MTAHFSRRIAVVLALGFIAPMARPALSADSPKAAEGGGELAALQKKFLGEWRGGACQGNYTFKADGTYECKQFTPGQNTMTGEWKIRWDALPPTLVLTCKTSDFKTKNPAREEYAYLDKPLEVKLTQLDDKQAVIKYADGYTNKWERPEQGKEKAKKALPDGELSALQGIWTPLHYEEGGEIAEPPYVTQHIIRGDHLSVVVDGATVAEGKVVFDATASPKRLDLELTSGQKHSLIYARAGDTVIYAGNRSDTRPTEFASGTASGGEYLISWKIEKLTEAKAIEIAEGAMKARFAADHVDKYKPYRADLRDGVWHVYGTLPDGVRGGTPEVTIRQADGAVLKVLHAQ